MSNFIFLPSDKGLNGRQTLTATSDSPSWCFAFDSSGGTCHHPSAGGSHSLIKSSPHVSDKSPLTQSKEMSKFSWLLAKYQLSRARSAKAKKDQVVWVQCRTQGRHPLFDRQVVRNRPRTRAPLRDFMRPSRCILAVFLLFHVNPSFFFRDAESFNVQSSSPQDLHAGDGTNKPYQLVSACTNSLLACISHSYRMPSSADANTG